MKTKLQMKADTLKEINRRKEDVQKELQKIKQEIKELNLKYKSEKKHNEDGFNDPANTKVFIKIAEVSVKDESLYKKSTTSNMKLFFTVNLRECADSQHHTSKQEDIDLNINTVEEQQRLIYRFREKFQFILQTGLETLKIKLYGIASDDEFEIAEFQLKLVDQLVKLVDQRDHVDILKNEQLEAKVVLRWIYDSDIERLGDLQQKQFQIEKELFKIEDSYSKAVKNIQQMQQKAPQITKIQEDWGVFLVSPKAMPHHFHSLSGSNKNLPQLTHSHTPTSNTPLHHQVKTVHIDLGTKQQTETAKEPKILPPTQDNLKKLDQSLAKKRMNMQGSIMDAIFSELQNKKPSQAKSMALSSSSVFSQMRTGTFFKMVDSPFKFSMMNAYEKMQNKGLISQSTINGGASPGYYHGATNVGFGSRSTMNENMGVFNKSATMFNSSAQKRNTMIQKKSENKNYLKVDLTKYQDQR